MDLTRQRLLNQHISGHQFSDPAEVVRWLGAVQAQDYHGALWAVGLRTQNGTLQTVEQAIADGRIIRTWPMRGTIHFIAPADARWMLRLLTPRVVARSQGRMRQFEIDAAVLGRSRDILIKTLQGGKQITRPALYAELDRAGISTAGQRGLHILFCHAHDGLICFGPRQGKQPTFALLEEWVPATRELARDEALAEVARRYFVSHGPATLHDFMWWSGLTAADAKAGLEMAKPHLASESVDGKTYWFARDMLLAGDDGPTTYLLPCYDEYLVAYTDRGAALDERYEQQTITTNGIFNPTVVMDGRVAGLWKRAAKKDRVVISTIPFAAWTQEQKDAIATASQAVGRFMQLAVALEER